MSIMTWKKLTVQITPIVLLHEQKKKKAMKFGGLNENGLIDLCLNIWSSIESVWEGFEGMDLLDEVCHWG